MARAHSAFACRRPARKAVWAGSGLLVATGLGCVPRVVPPLVWRRRLPDSLGCLTRFCWAFPQLGQEVNLWDEGGRKGMGPISS